MQIFSEDESRELFPLSWLSQYGYCKRRCSLLALEQIWQENEYTAAGRIQHKRVHTGRTEQRGDAIHIYEMPVFSRRLGVSGFCDRVEAHPSPSGASIPYGEGKYTFYPVEYKHGVVRDEEEYHLQLCAQAICLEEMFQTNIPVGHLYYGESRRRTHVEFTDKLREDVKKMAEEMHNLFQKGYTPNVKPAKHCKACSLNDLCVPRLQRTKKAREYIEQSIRAKD